MSTSHVSISHTKSESIFARIASSLCSHGWIITWPEGLSYLAWQNFLRSYLWFTGTGSRPEPKPRNGKRESARKCGHHQHAKCRLGIQPTEKQITTIIQGLDVAPPESGEVKLELITLLKTFWERKHIPQHIEDTIPDRRNPELITYSKQSIMMSALSIFLFRMASGNKYDDKCHDDDEKYSLTNVAKFIDAPEDRVPVIKTVETFLKNLEEQSVNDLMIAFFKDLQKSKFFKQHTQIMPGDFFLLAADCVHTHTYEHPHHTDACGANDCEHCLKRVYNKETENETVRWVHNTLVFCFVFMGGLKIPIYTHPIRAKQVTNLESASEDSHKQECELVALKSALPIIREAFPRMKLGG